MQGLDQLRPASGLDSLVNMLAGNASEGGNFGHRSQSLGKRKFVVHDAQPQDNKTRRGNPACRAPRPVRLECRTNPIA